MSSQQNQQLNLLNGERFIRHINYLRGSVDETPDENQPAISPECIIHADQLAAASKRGPTKIIAVANNKGGVGKTTTARYLGLGLAQSGQRVLLVDMDPQANLTQFALNVYESDLLPRAHLGTYFAGKASLKELACPSAGHPRMWIVPSHPQLGKRDTGGAGRPDVELGFARDLHAAFASETYLPGKKFDFIIIDTPPAVSLFTRSALAAADYILVPARARDSS